MNMEYKKVENLEMCPSDEDKKKDLFLRQKKTLDTFLATGAISKAQYDKSLGDLIEKMEMQGIVDAKGNEG